MKIPFIEITTPDCGKVYVNLLKVKHISPHEEDDSQSIIHFQSYSGEYTYMITLSETYEKVKKILEPVVNEITF
ncbi:hypothetical protein ACFLSA_00820 [Bacteroidota bacterium]